GPPAGRRQGRARRALRAQRRDAELRGGARTARARHGPAPAPADRLGADRQRGGGAAAGGLRRRAPPPAAAPRDGAHPSPRPAGRQTIAHRHPRSEELYFFTAGSGRVRVGEDEREVAAGDCVVIPPGTPHKLWAGATEPLVLLCCCSPPYADDDTELLEPVDAA